MAVKTFKPEDFLVLVVDDVSANLKVVGAMLDQVGYATTFATNGQQALERMQRAHPDLLLLDLMMPEMDGLEVCQQLKANPIYSNTPIIFLTASHERDHMLQAFEHGAVDFVTKPFSKAELLARVKTHLMLKHTNDELKKALAEVERLASTDPLTGALNRRSLFEAAEQEFNRARRYNSVFSVLMLDLDHFKKINDVYGHLVGDRVLCLLVEQVSQTLRNVDYLGRYGGEEFTILLPETDLQAAIEVAERIRHLVMTIEIPDNYAATQVTASIGITVYDPSDETIDRVFERADKALYQAKQHGRNQYGIMTVNLFSAGTEPGPSVGAASS